MANQKISQFSRLTTINGDELLAVATNGVNKSVTIKDIIDQATTYSCRDNDQDIRINQNSYNTAVLTCELNTTKTALDNLSYDVSQISDSLSYLYESTYSNFNNVTSYIDENKQVIDEHAYNITHIHADNISINNKLLTLDTQLRNVQSRLNAIESSVVNLCKSVESIQTNEANNYSYTQVNKASIETINGLITSLQSRLSYIENLYT